MNNIERLFDELKKCVVSPSEDIIDSAIEEYNQIQQKDFWSNWVYPEGANPEDIQKKLMDYHDYMIETSKVYMYFTNNNISKVNTKSESVINEIERFWEMKGWYDDEINE